MSKIYLTRHGETDWNAKRMLQGHTDTSLNETGRAQAEALAKEAVKLGIKHIFSSDLLRAKETAEIVGESLGLDIVFDKRLRELGFGDFEGRDYYTISEQEWAGFNENPESFNAETKQQLYDRVKNFLGEICGKNLGNVLVVSHGGALKMFLFCEKYAEFDKDEFQKDFFVRLQNAKIIEFKGLANQT